MTAGHDKRNSVRTTAAGFVMLSLVSDGSVRIDRWLSAARIYKSRTACTDACAGGHVKINGSSARPSNPVRVGDRIEAVAPRGPLVLEVRKLGEKRLSPPMARELYDDFSPPPPPKEERPMLRPRGTGRPTKADARALRRLRGR
ncbi:MAG TPA: RNA-binding S4 domain-containing protein [Polyangiaceae bacterium]|nr:RNA-binding S4 domain-containing protein [Polyangiaceae bacterium]HMR77026.1 RNA-binding S4 domain-containing protein [Polyangiaceae bacterium]